MLEKKKNLTTKDQLETTKLFFTVANAEPGRNNIEKAIFKS
jgi:hypothetical protein